jgi:hypothetical protein
MLISDHGIQSYYWAHWEFFPHNRDVPQEVLEELKGILIHAGIGRFVFVEIIGIITTAPTRLLNLSGFYIYIL